MELTYQDLEMLVKNKMNYLRGFGYQGGASRGNWSSSSEAYLAGEDLIKNAVNLENGQ